MAEKFVFAGNRAYVLERMLELGLEVVHIWAVNGSYLQKFLVSHNMDYSVIDSKEKMIKEIQNVEFDYFISNGLPIILPISKMNNINATKKYINIHPSLLPDLRGRDPIPGAILFQRDAGATCHYMDDGIDTGALISQIKIGKCKDLDAGLLYQLSFLAEADAFEKAYKNKFESRQKPSKTNNEIYYTFKESDLEINIEKENINKINAKIKAFSTKNKRAFFYYKNEKYVCIDSVILNIKYLEKKMMNKKNREVVLSYEDKIIYKSNNKFIEITVQKESRDIL